MKVLFILLFIWVMFGYRSIEISKKLDEFMLYQKNISEGENIIEIRCYYGSMPELYVNNKRVTDNLYGIEYTPHINDKGQYAYVLYDESCSKGKVYVNSTEICDVYCGKILAITDDVLFFSSVEGNNTAIYKQKLSLRGIKASKICTLQGEYLTKAVYEEEVGLYIEAWDGNTTQLNVSILFESESGEWNRRKFDATEKMLVTTKEGTYIDVIEGNDNGKYLFNSLYYYNYIQPGNPFSIGNDFAGRLCWNVVYRLHGLIELYEKTEDEEVLEEIRNSCSNLMGVTNEKLGLESEYICDSVWATRKYSLNKEELRSDVVGNGQILYPLLKAVNMDLLETSMEEEIIRVAEESFVYFDKFYQEGHYYWEYESPFYLDGVILPWNQQNAYGLALIELYKATGDVKYYDRCNEMMIAFKEEWVVSEEDVIWHYWPLEFYSGWKESDKISSNTPMRAAAEDNLYEDTSHAAINAKFIREYYRIFDDEVITEGDIEGIRNAMKRFCLEEGFSRFISGDVEYTEKSYQYIPGIWWVEWENDVLRKYWTNLGTFLYPDFDYMHLYEYAYLYSEKLPIEARVDRYRLVNSTLELEEGYTFESYEEMKRYFEETQPE